jgi:hypothetical protein
MPFPTFFFAVCIDVDDQTQFINEYFLHFILQDFRPDGQLRNGECSLQDEDLKSLRAKIAMLEEELRKSRQDSSEYHHLVRNLENEVKDLKDQEQQGKQKVRKLLFPCLNRLLRIFMFFYKILHLLWHGYF